MEGHFHQIDEKKDPEYLKNIRNFLKIMTHLSRNNDLVLL